MPAFLEFPSVFLPKRSHSLKLSFRDHAPVPELAIQELSRSNKRYQLGYHLKTVRRVSPHGKATAATWSYRQAVSIINLTLGTERRCGLLRMTIRRSCRGSRSWWLPKARLVIKRPWIPTKPTRPVSASTDSMPAGPLEGGADSFSGLEKGSSNV